MAIQDVVYISQLVFIPEFDEHHRYPCLLASQFGDPIITVSDGHHSWLSRLIMASCSSLIIYPLSNWGSSGAKKTTCASSCTEGYQTLTNQYGAEESRNRNKSAFWNLPFLGKVPSCLEPQNSMILCFCWMINL